jgi:3-oxoacyl-[acyl-carrier protein] reductase
MIIIGITGGSATILQADVSKASDVDRLFSETKRIYGRIDIVVANSGIAHRDSIASMSNDNFDRVIDVNLKGVFYTLRAAANLIENNGWLPYTI